MYFCYRQQAVYHIGYYEVPDEKACPGNQNALIRKQIIKCLKFKIITSNAAKVTWKWPRTASV